MSAKPLHNLARVSRFIPQEIGTRRKQKFLSSRISALPPWRPHPEARLPVPRIHGNCCGCHETSRDIQRPAWPTRCRRKQVPRAASPAIEVALQLQCSPRSKRVSNSPWLSPVVLSTPANCRKFKMRKVLGGIYILKAKGIAEMFYPVRPAIDSEGIL